jgi:hypothetical protein
MLCRSVIVQRALSSSYSTDSAVATVFAVQTNVAKQLSSTLQQCVVSVGTFDSAATACQQHVHKCAAMCPVLLLQASIRQLQEDKAELESRVSEMTERYIYTHIDCA